MNTFVKINSINYPAEIYGHVRDTAWDGRESKVIVLALTIQEALALFTDNVQWSIVYGTQTIPQDEFIIAGPITDNRNGTVSVRMGKPTAAEVSSVITGEQIANIDLPTAYAMRSVIEESVASLDDETAATVPSLFTTWTAGEAVEVGDRRYYAPTRLLYKVREGQGHTTQADWTPDVTPALWAVLGDPGQAGTIDDPITAARGMEYTYGLYYFDPEDGKTYLCERIGEAEGGKIILQYLPHELIGQYFSAAESGETEEPAEPDTGDTYPAWVQPTGAHDAYNTGDRVTYNGRVYESTMDGNTWSPDAYPQGWEDLGEVTA